MYTDEMMGGKAVEQTKILLASNSQKNDNALSKA